MGVSDVIAGFISDVIEAKSGSCELQRAELATRFGCVPSQINYVVSTRFTPERGYIVESRRGSGGYIRITRVRMDPRLRVMHTVNVIGGSVDARTARALLSNLLDAMALDMPTAQLMLSAVSEPALCSLPAEQRGELRANILKQMLVQHLK